MYNFDYKLEKIHYKVIFMGRKNNIERNSFWKDTSLRI